MSAFNSHVIAQFRRNNGPVDGFGNQLVVLHAQGARTGAERVKPAMSRRDGQDWLVVATAMGVDRDPAWVQNLRANPDMTIEVAFPDGVRIVHSTPTNSTAPSSSPPSVDSPREHPLSATTRTAPDAPCQWSGCTHTRQVQWIHGRRGTHPEVRPVLL